MIKHILKLSSLIFNYKVATNRNLYKQSFLYFHMEKSKIKGVIYDMDGVIVKTEHIQYLGWVVPLIRDFDTDLSKEFYIQNYSGKSGKEIEELIKNDFKLNFEKGLLLHEKEKLLPGWFESWPMTEMLYAKESIDFFKNSGVKMAIASGGTPEEIIIKLKKMNLEDKFEEVVSAKHTQRGKPFGDVYKLAAQKIGIEPRYCLAIEDTQSGVESASDGGMGVIIAIPHEYSRTDKFLELCKEKASITANNLKEAVEQVKERYELISSK